MRKTVWKQKVVSKANQALFLAKYILENESTSETNSKTENSTN
jgi:hypothetical protein